MEDVLYKVTQLHTISTNTSITTEILSWVLNLLSLNIPKSSQCQWVSSIALQVHDIFTRYLRYHHWQLIVNSLDQGDTCKQHTLPITFHIFVLPGYRLFNIGHILWWCLQRLTAIVTCDDWGEPMAFVYTHKDLLFVSTFMSYDYYN